VERSLFCHRIHDEEEENVTDTLRYGSPDVGGLRENLSQNAFQKFQQALL
jgi:hypothetical protein